MKKTLCMFFALLVLTMSCGGGEAERLMNEADSIMELHADSALRILQSIDSAQIGDVSQQAKYSLLMTQARVKNNLVSLADTAALPYLEYCYRHGTDYDRMRAAFYTGWLYYQYQDYVKAVRHLNLARDIAQICDNHYWLAKIYEAKADIYGLNGLDDDAVRNRMKARDNYNLAGKALNADYSVCDLSMDYRHVGNLDESARLLDSLLQINESGNSISTGLHCYILRQQAILNLEMSEYERADSCLRMQDSLAGGAYDYYGTLRVMTAMAVRQNHPEQDSLLNIYRSVMLNGSDSAYYYGMMRAVERARKNYEQADLYADSMIFFQNSEVSRVLRQSILREEFEIQTESNTILKRRNKIIVYLTLAVLVLFITAAIGYRIYIKIQAKKKDALVDRITAELAASEISFNDYKRDAESRIEGLHNDLLQAEQRASCIKEEQSPDNNQIAKLQDIYASRIDVLSSVCLKYIDSVSSKDKEHSYETILKILGALSSKEAILEQEAFVNNFYDGLLYRFKADFPKIYRDNLELLVLLGTGMRPRMVAAILHKPDQTIYTKRKRIAKEIADSSVKDKDEYLSFFRM